MNCSVPGRKLGFSLPFWPFGNLPRPLLLTSVIWLWATDRFSVSAVEFSIVDKLKYEDDKDKGRKECQTVVLSLTTNLTKQGKTNHQLMLHDY
jgi:hypothetical protein